MSKYIMFGEELLQWLQNLAKESKVLAPVKEEYGYTFAEWDKKSLPGDDYRNTLKPPKDLFFPQHETLLKYEKIKGENPLVEVPDLPEDKRVIFGIRPCDASSLVLLDNIFMGEDYVDPYYEARRSNTLIVSLVCRTRGKSCFCEDLFSTKGSDILIIKVDGNYLVEILTYRGEAAFKGIGSKEADEKIVKKADKLKRTQEEVLDKDIFEKLRTIYDNPIWKQLQEKCVNCGVCTFLCPTCHCFDITDDKRGKKVRSWDSCMFASFTKQASGHNPRPTGTERLRQRIMHKFYYFPEKYHDIACVGCGRCVEKCPVNLDIRQVIEKIRGCLDEKSLSAI